MYYYYMCHYASPPPRNNSAQGAWSYHVVHVYYYVPTRQLPTWYCINSILHPSLSLHVVRVYCNAHTRQPHTVCSMLYPPQSLELATPETKSIHRRCHPRKSISHAVVSRRQLFLHAPRPTSHGASYSYKQCLPGR